MRERGLNEVKVMLIVKVDVHTPIFYFPKYSQVAEWQTLTLTRKVDIDDKM
jgi:hypothetical protein